MADAPPSTTENSSTTILDLNMDSLVQCASYLNLRDILNMALTCKYFKRAAYSDSTWQRLFREHWPQQMPSRFPVKLGIREAFLGRHIALQQFKFVDPLVADFYTDAKPYNHVFLDENNIIYSQGALIKMINIEGFLNGRDSLMTLSDHKARITCMRWFSLNEASLFLSERSRNENILVSSSSDHSIRLWWKGRCQRCFRGHNGPVTTLSDKLLGDNNAKVLASGGEDGTVRLWSLSSSGKRGQHALKATLYGHEKPVALMSVAGHKTSLLASMSKDSKVRIWDTNASSSVRSCCVGMTFVPGAPVGMKFHGSLLHIAAGSSVVAIDLRTMQKAFSTPIQEPKLYSFEIFPSKSLICTGGNGSAMLWDMRKISEQEAVYELDGHLGAVTQLYMDPYKIVTGGPNNPYMNVWDPDSGTQTNSLICSNSVNSGCSAMAVNGCRIVSASCSQEHGMLRFRDFYNATTCRDETTELDLDLTSKFWASQLFGDTEEDDDDDVDEFYG